MIYEINEKRIREIAREEILKREMEKIGMIRKIDALTKNITKGSNEGVQGVEL